jgi:hypothetical protein
MSGSRRIELVHKPTSVKWDHLLVLLVFGFVALGIVIGYYGWELTELVTS